MIEEKFGWLRATHGQWIKIGPAFVLGIENKKICGWDPDGDRWPLTLPFDCDQDAQQALDLYMRSE